MWWQETIWKQMWFDHTTFQNSIPSLGFRTTTCNHVFHIYIYMCFLVMSFAQFLICCGCFLLKASLLMSSWLVILLLSFLAATCFCRTFTPPASPRTRGPRTRCKFTRRCFFFRCHKKGRHGAGMWRGWRSDAPGEQRHQQGELPEEV